MSNKDLKLKPKNLKVKGASAAWFYEENKGLEVVVEIKTMGSGGDTNTSYANVAIPWQTIRASLKRKDLK